MNYIKRAFNLSELLENGSIFFLGPRQTGKTKYIENELNNLNVVAFFSFLDNETLYNFREKPSNLRKYLTSLNTNEGIVIIDEVQEFPDVLSDVHHMIEHSNFHFLLTGSSARKIKRKGGNLLGGRAGIFNIHPFVWPEIKHLNLTLKEIFEKGMVPSITLSSDSERMFKNYIESYLKMEIEDEALVRNLRTYRLFLQMAAGENTNLLNYSNIASQSTVSVETIKSWYRILEDTRIGYFLPPLRKSTKRKSVSSSKFYLFDVGIARVMAKQSVLMEHDDAFGRYLETYIFQEINAYIDYKGLYDDLTFWRTQDGKEVDFVIENKAAIEVKSTNNPQNKHFKGLRTFGEEFQKEKKILITTESFKWFTDDGIACTPWSIFLDELWDGKII